MYRTISSKDREREIAKSREIASGFQRQKKRTNKTVTETIKQESRNPWLNSNQSSSDRKTTKTVAKHFHDSDDSDDDFEFHVEDFNNTYDQIDKRNYDVGVSSDDDLWDDVGSEAPMEEPNEKREKLISQIVAMRRKQHQEHMKSTIRSETSMDSPVRARFDDLTFSSDDDSSDAASVDMGRPLSSSGWRHSIERKEFSKTTSSMGRRGSTERSDFSKTTSSMDRRGSTERSDFSKTTSSMDRARSTGRHDFNRTSASAQSTSSTQSFEIRDRRRREMMEEIERKKAQEEAEHQVRIKARPIPASTLLPKYEQMQEDSQNRSAHRQKEHKEKIESKVQPFRGIEARAAKQEAKRLEKERKRQAAEKAERAGIKATPVPNYRSSEQVRQEQEDAERRRREARDLRAQQLLQESSLPPRMKVDSGEEKRNQLQQKMKEEFDSTCTFRPNIKSTVPDFEMSKKKWTDTISKVRKSNTTTQPDVSHLSMFNAANMAKSDEKRKKLEEQIQVEKDEYIREREAQQEKVRKVQEAARKSTAIVSMTKSEELRLQRTTKRKEEEHSLEQQEKDKLADKLKRQKERAAVIRSLIEQEEQRRQATTGYLSLADATKKAKANARMDAELWKERSEEMKRKMSNPRPDRAPLFQQNGEMIRKSERRENAVSKVASLLVKSKVGVRDVMDNEEYATVEDKVLKDEIDLGN